MIRKLIFSTFFVCLFSYMAYAQSDTMYFDADWQITTKSKASFYRPKPQPKGSGYLFKDYYISGALQMEGFSKSDTAELFQGIITWYNENGKVTQKAMYVDGYQEGELITFNTDGTELSRGVNKDGAPYSGSFYEAGNSFYSLTFYQAGVRQKFMSIANTGSSKAKVEVVFDEQGRAKEAAFYDQAGNLIGKTTVDEDEKIIDGVLVSYYLNPMAVESIQKVNDGKYVGVTAGYYLNGKIKYFRYLDTDKNKTKEVYFDRESRMGDSIIYKDGSPFNGKQYIFFNPYYGDATVSERPERITTYKNGEMHGTDQEFYPNGNLKSSVTYANNIITGTRITCDSTGKIKHSMLYKDGYPFAGTAFTYDNSIETYKDGVLTEETRFHPNGKMIYNKTLANGVTVYDTAGRVLSRLEYKDGLPWNGKTITFSDDQISFEEEYKNGQKTFECYYTEGQPTEKTVYNNNERISSQFYNTGKPKQETKYVDDAEREITYYAINGKLLGKLQTNEKYELSGTKCVFYEDSLVQITEYSNNNIIKDKQFFNNTMLCDINYFGKSVFNDPFENKNYTCFYKEGKPYNGVEIAYDESYKTVKKISNYTNGQLHGDQISKAYNYETEKNEITHKETYIMDVKNGLDQEFYNGSLMKETVYKNGFREGEIKCYNTDGEVIATGLYKDDNPWSGKLIDYAYNFEINSETSYKDGQLDGPLNYYYGGVLSKTDLYKSGMIEKTTIFEDGSLKYTLIYKNGEPFDGITKDYSGISTYTNGALTERVVIEYDNVKSREIYNETGSVLSNYYANGKIKSAILFENGSKNGKSTFFNTDGLVLGVGQYKDDVPVAGKFIFFSNDQENAWVELTINKAEFVAAEIVEGKVVKRLKNEILSGNTEEISGEIKTFIAMIVNMFSTYEIERSY